ncbi:MAG TPA: hypothetical protein VF272_00170 [Candidatus Saccharimonadia bacterium]
MQHKILVERIICIMLVATISVASLCVPFGAQAGTESTQPGDLHLITSPLPILLTVKPGTTTTTDLRIKNAGSTTERLRVDMLKFGASGEEGQPALKDPEPGDEQFKWASFSQTIFNAEPNEWKTVKMTIKVPTTAAYGYYYAITFSRANKEAKTTDQRAVLRGATAVLVLLEATSPNTKRKVQMVDFVSNKGLYEYLPASFKVRLHNIGNIHTAPVGSVFITKGSKPIGSMSINKEHGSILPNSYRIYQTEWKDGFPHYAEAVENNQTAINKKGQQEKRLVWNLGDIGKIRFGKYTASVVMVYDDGKRDIPVEAAVSFWVIPWRFLLIVGLVVTLMLAGLWAMVRVVRPSRRAKRRR